MGCLTVAGFALPVEDARAEPVAVTGMAGDGYDRLIFAWPLSVQYTAERFGDQLVIRFNRTIEAEMGAAAAQLGTFVSGARLGRDGRSVVVDLTGNHRLRGARNGNQVIIDLISRNANPPPIAVAQPTPSPAPASAAPASAAPASAAPSVPRLGVRSGRHETYDRIVFDWTGPVDFQVRESDGSASVTFDRPARVDDARVRARLPSALRGFSSRTTDDGLVVTIPLPEGRSLNTFRSGPKVVVDVRRASGSGNSAPPQTAQAQQPAAQPQPEPQPQAQPAAQPQAQAAAQTETVPQPQVQSPLISIPTTTAPAPTPGEQAEAQANAPAPATPSETPAQAAVPPPLDSQDSEDGSEGDTAGTTAPAGGRSPSEDALVPADGVAVPPPDPEGANVTRMTDATTGVITGGIVPVTAQRLSESVSVRFEWTETVGAVAFTRAGYLWVGFDRPARFDTSGMMAAIAELGGRAEQVPVPTGSVLRMPVVEGISARVWRDGEAWVFDLQPQTARPDVALRVDAQMVSPQGPRLFVPVEAPGETILIQDPEVGDRLFLIPVTSLSRGIDGDRTYVQASLLSSVQGLVIRPRSSELEIRLLPDGVAIATEGGMKLSGPSERSADDPFSGNRFDGMASGLAPGRIFDMSAWRLGSEADYLPRKKELQLRVAEATSISRSGPRLDLAEFYFSRGLASEAIGLLRTIAQSDEDLANRPDVKALRGAASFMLGRYEEAEDFLDDTALNGFSEAELWRGAATAAQGKWDQAVEHFARAGEIPGGYPRNFTTELALLGAEAAIRAGDYRGAGAYLDVISEGTPTDGERARLDFLRGRVLSAFGDQDAALDIWRRLATSEDRWARVRAERALIENDLAANEITRTEATARLDRLRFAWRGDRIEFDLLRRLGELQLEEKEYENGLDALRQAVTFFPNNPETRQVADDLTRAFSDIFTLGASDAMTPLQALALYDRFRELTPVGAEGDQIIESLADRLVRVDLLDRAARLLDRQVKFRLQGENKARVGSRLALINLLDRQPDSAINALDESVAPGLDADLAAERRRLRARAVFELSDTAGALKLLEKDDSRSADLLRADIYWRSQEWVEAAKVFRRLVGDAGLDGRRLEVETAGFILNWAVSMSLSDNTVGLSRLRQIYASKMDATPYREAFRLITNETDGELGDFMNLSERFEEIGRFQAFLSGYRERLKTDGLSATN
jgi:tetratricopeptide (TPR) repeat protein